MSSIYGILHPNKRGKGIYFPTYESFDEHFRPIIKTEWPIDWLDDTGGGYIQIVAFPSSFVDALEVRDPDFVNVPECEWRDLGNAAADRLYDRLHEDENEPKRFDLKRRGERIRLNFRIGNAGLGMKSKWPGPRSWGNMGFDAMVTYEDLEVFLDQLKVEREVIVMIKS